MSDNSDKVGKAIYPKDLDRVLGKRFFSSQFLGQSGINSEQKEATLRYLIGREFIEPWLAPKCPHCEYTWPLCQEEKDIGAKIECPVCNEVFSPKEASFYEIYRVIKDPSDL